MDKDAHLELSEDDRAHQEVMRSIAMKMADTPYVLKGGTALLFTRGLNRHSTDLDFDANKAVNMTGRIRESFKEQGLNIERLGIKRIRRTNSAIWWLMRTPKQGIETA